MQKHEEDFQRETKAHNEFHDKEIEDQKVTIRRLATSYKNLKGSIEDTGIPSHPVVKKVPQLEIPSFLSFAQSRGIEHNQVPNEHTSLPSMSLLEEAGPVLQQIVPYAKLASEVQLPPIVQMQHGEEVCTHGFPSFNGFLHDHKIEVRESTFLQEGPHIGEFDVYQSSFDLFDELPGFVDEEEDHVQVVDKENLDSDMLSLEHEIEEVQEQNYVRHEE